MNAPIPMDQRLRACEERLAACATRMFFSEMAAFARREGPSQIRQATLAELHVNSIRRAYVAEIDSNLYEIPLADTDGNPNGWLLEVLNAEAPMLKTSVSDFATLMLDYIQHWYTAAAETASGTDEAALAERFFALYASIADNASEPLRRLQTRRFDPSTVDPTSATSFWSLVEESMMRNSEANGDHRRALHLSFDEDFSLVDWYLLTFAPEAGAASPSRLHRLVSELLLRPGLFADWDRFPPGTPPMTRDQRSDWMLHVEATIDNSTDGVADRAFLICLVDANRARMVRRLEAIRALDPIAATQASVGNEFFDSAIGVRESLNFVAATWPELAGHITPVMHAYTADLLGRMNIWLAGLDDTRSFTLVNFATSQSQTDHLAMAPVADQSAGNALQELVSPTFPEPAIGSTLPSPTGPPHAPPTIKAPADFSLSSVAPPAAALGGAVSAITFDMSNRPLGYTASMRHQMYDALRARGLEQWMAFSIAEANYRVGESRIPQPRVPKRQARQLTNRCLDGKIDVDELWHQMWGESRRVFAERLVRSVTSQALDELPLDDPIITSLQQTPTLR